MCRRALEGTARPARWSAVRERPWATSSVTSVTIGSLAPIVTFRPLLSALRLIVFAIAPSVSFGGVVSAGGGGGGGCVTVGGGGGGGGRRRCGGGASQPAAR